MSNRLKNLDKPDFDLLKRPQREPLFDLTLSLITPMFGGGHTAREIDRERPVNAKQIRGHLRFWWRACHAHRYSTTQEMFKAEARLFGQSAGFDEDGKAFGSGLVDVVVEILTPIEQITPQVCDLREPTPNIPAPRQPLLAEPFVSGGLYALFGLVGTLTNNRRGWKEKPAEFLQELKFKVKLVQVVNTCDSLSKTDWNDLKLALAAWVNLGGVGARTRRGLGSLRCTTWGESVPVGAQNAERDEPETFAPAQTVSVPDLNTVISGIRAIASASTPVWGHCRLATCHVFRKRSCDDMGAWGVALTALKEFRQTPHGRPDYHQSNWPETDAIRRAATAPAGGWVHPARTGMPDYYPRADLGLPIVLHFMEKQPYTKPEPGDHRIEGGREGQTRMASPVITKAMAVSDTQSVPLIVVLNAPHVWDADAPPIVLKPENNILSGTALTGPVPAFAGPMCVGGTTYGTAREALRAYARQQGFKEETI